MNFDFLNFGFLFIVLALFGFVVKDIVNLSQYWNFPDDYKSDTERFFNYISTALLIIAFATILLSPFIISKDPNIVNNFLNATSTSVNTLHDSQYISDETYAGIIQNTSLAILGVVIFSYLYIFIYLIAFFFGVLLRYTKAYGVNVFLKSDPNSPVPFRELIRESEQFFFFEKMGGLNMWVAIRKEDVVRMDMITSPSRAENFCSNLNNILSQKFPRYAPYNHLAPFFLFMGIFGFLSGASLLIKRDLNAAIVFIVVLLFFGLLAYIFRNKRQKSKMP